MNLKGLVLYVQYMTVVTSQELSVKPSNLNPTPSVRQNTHKAYQQDQEV